MRKIISVIFMVCLILTSCGPSAVDISTQTAIAFTGTAASWTKTPTATQTSTTTPTPTSTSTPTPEPTPFAGGGKIYLSNDKLEAFTTNFDGTNLTKFDYDWFHIIGISPDKKRMLVDDNDTIVIMNPDGTDRIVIDSTPNLYLSNSSYGGGKNVIWLSNGKIIFLASEQPGGWAPEKSIYITDQDGSQVRKLEKPFSQITYGRNLLFTSFDEESVYWGTYKCGSINCDGYYFKTYLDDSGQEEVWTEIHLNMRDEISLSPSGDYISIWSDEGCFYSTILGENITRVGDECRDWNPEEDILLSLTYNNNNQSPFDSINNKIISAFDGKSNSLQIKYGIFIDAIWLSTDLILFASPQIELKRSSDNRYLYMIMMNIKTFEENTFYGDERYNCSLSPPDSLLKSPDEEWIILSNCDSNSGKVKKNIINQRTRTVRPLFYMPPEESGTTMLRPVYWLP